MSTIQYTSSNSIPSNVRDTLSSKVRPWNDYIILQTGQGQYTLLEKSLFNDDCRSIVAMRSNDGTYHYTEQESEFDFIVTNETVVYSNIGYGSRLDLPVVQEVNTVCIVALTILVFIWVLFGRVFRWRGRKLHV